MIHLQKRDLEILKCCYEQQFLTLQHIEDHFFKSVTDRKARERISELERAGLVVPEKAITFGNRKIIRLTPIGQKLAKNESAYDVPQSKRLDLSTLLHDTIVTSVRLRLAELWDGKWVPEKALKDKYPQIPDGLFQFFSGTTIAIEVENSEKGRTRFLEILKGWESVVGLDMVLYFATSDRLYELIKRYLVQAPTKPPFALAQWNSLRQGIPEVYSPAGTLSLFAKRSF